MKEKKANESHKGVRRAANLKINKSVLLSLNHIF